MNVKTTFLSNIRELNLTNLRDQLGYVGQESQLFDTSVGSKFVLAVLSDLREY